MRKFVYDMFDHITPPTFILSTKYHKHLGNINGAINIANDFNMGSHQEISFDVYKTLDGVKCDLWDSIVDFKYVYVPEHDEYYEIQVNIDDSNNTVKHVVGISAGECELSQRYLRDFHCNDDTDIGYEPKYKCEGGKAKLVNPNGVVDFAYDMYESDKLDGQDELIKATVFYRPLYPTDSDDLRKKKKRASLLHRVLHDKCPDWSISIIGETLANIQRTFSTDSSTIYDFLVNTIANEIGCLFTFNSVSRAISAYDLKNTCTNCGFRGEFTAKCPKCGSKSHIRGYGAWKNVYVSPENTALQISVDGDTDSVKNCFRVTGGDDLMTATVRNINPNRSSYIYRISDDMKADMPIELVDKLNAYENDYNSVVDTYEQLTEQWYETINQIGYLQTSKMPKTPIPADTTAQEQLDIIMAVNPLKVSVETIDSSNPTQTMADNAVQGYLKAIVDTRYTVEVSGGVLSNTRRTWQGYITVKSLGGVDTDGNEDKATSSTKKTVTINDNYEDFLLEKIQKSLDRTDAGFMTIFKIEDDTEFENALDEYSLDRLNSFSNSYQALLEILVKQGVTKDYKDLYHVQLYNEIYLPYYNRKQLIKPHIVLREQQIRDLNSQKDSLENQRQDIQKSLDLEKYLGDLYNTFVLYLRENDYSNSNYISDGLDNGELINKARELLTAAQSDLIKASELQYTLTGNLINFLNTEEFKDFKDEFEIGDYIICKADDRLYRLRIVNVSYTYDAPSDISITFSNVVRGNNFMSDVQSILSRANSMATSFNYVAHQANQGDSANAVINGYKDNGFNTEVYNVFAGTNQDISMDSHGLTAKEFDDIAGDYRSEQLLLTSHSLAFTEDNWETASLSLGRHEYTRWDEDNQTFVTATGYGMKSQFVDSGYIRGSQIIAGDIYSENYRAGGSKGAHLDLINGEFTFADGKLKYANDKLYVDADVMVGSQINDAVITDSSINNNDKFILNKNGNLTLSGNVVLNGNVSGTAWETKQDKLTAGTNITIVDNVISASGGGGGSTVVPNPQGTAIGDLNKIGIDGDIYDIPVGSTVVPNPQGSPTGQLNKLSIDDVIYSLSGSGNANYAELVRDEYEPLPESTKNNDTIYFVKDPTVVEVPAEGMLIGEYYGIHNSKLNPDYVWSGGIKFFFNDSDFRYCLSQYTDYEYNSNAGMHPYYEHGDSDLNVLITQQMPVDTHYVAAYHSIYGLNCTTLIFIPKELIDSGKAVLMMQTFYTSEACELQYTYVWNDWTNPENYARMITVSAGAGMRSFAYNDLNILQSASVTGLWFTNCPLLGGDYLLNPLTQEEIDTYLATRQDNYPRYYNVNYFTFDHVMTPDYVGTVYLNSVDYTDRIDEIVSEVLVDGESVVIDGTARIDLSGKQDVLTAGTNITITDNTISATDTDALTELTDVNISSPTDGQTLIYDATNQEWINGSGGGGTTVIPNPQGTPTDTLSTIQIGNDIFEIEGGGGGSVKIVDTLWSGSETPTTSGTDITLDHAISDYDFIAFTITQNDPYDSVVTFPTSELTIGEQYVGTGYGASSMEAFFTYTSDTAIKVISTASANRTTYTKIVGLKFGGGGGEGDGYTSIKIWDYVDDNSGVISYGSYTHTLNDNINNYDMLAIENVSTSSDLSDANWSSSNLWYVDVNMLNSNINANYITYTSWDQRATRFYIKDTTFQATSNNGANTNGTVRVFGIKFGASGGSGNANYTELTQAEYDALTPEEQMNGTIYFITDGQGGGGSDGVFLAPMIYSTEEREVGVWVDDKPLYQKSFDLTSQALTDNAWNNGILGTTGISIKSYKGYFSLGTGALFPYEYYRNNSEFFTAVTDQNSSDINVRPNMNAGTSVYAGIVTVWYTKDSDVAGSGTYGSLGIPMEHYDDTEKVVGTYFGETLYEKSYQNIAGTGTSVDVTLSDLSNIETIFIVPEASASTDEIPFPYLHPSSVNVIGGFFTINNGVPTLSIRRGSDSSGYGLKYLTVRYTKITT